MSSRFTDVSPESVDRLIREHPLSWIVPHGAPQHAMLMPVLVAAEVQGGLGLLGHLPKSAKATAALQDNPDATFLILGPNRYISPAMAGQEDWAPTWNFVSLKLSGRVILDESVTRQSVEQLVQHMEGPEGWTMSSLGPRASNLLSRIIGFRANIDRINPRFKLGQDERPEVQGSTLEALQDDPLVDWVPSR